MSDKPDHLNSWSKAELAMIRQNCCQTNDDKHFELFLYKAHQLKLNPLMNQIYSIPRGGERNILVSIDGQRSIAQRTGLYMPGEEIDFQFENNQLIKAKVFVKKLDAQGQWHKIPGIAYLKEYAGPGPLWRSKPTVMLSKCAEALALRRAFPAEMGGIYTEDEMALSMLDDETDTKKGLRNKSSCITEEQFQRIHDLIGERHDILERILKHCQLQDLKQLPAKDFEMMHRGIVNQFKRETRNHTTTEEESLNV